MTYKLTRKAAFDLRRIYVEGVRLFGVEQAARYHARLEQAFGLLSANPRLNTGYCRNACRSCWTI